MGLVIHPEKIDANVAEQLVGLCPFGALQYDGKLTVGSGCKLCKLCVKQGPAGAVTFEEETLESCNKTEWNGVAVFAQWQNGTVHPVSMELIGKARELAAVTGQKVLALLIGTDLETHAKELLTYGVDTVYVYDHPAFFRFMISPYANAFCDFIEQVKPSSILVGATMLGRSLAPKVAARVHTGLTADCTMLQMKENTDLVQIRPAFGGNIMAQIVTPRTRPQFCTVRYKVFSAPPKGEPTGTIRHMEVTELMLKTRTRVLKTVEKPKETDISDASILVAVGRGLKSKDDIPMIKAFADRIGAQLACTRPLVENGWFDAKKQIGLSGRTVKPNVIITLGVSGSVQFTAGMRNADLIIAVNRDKNASIFDVAHYGFVGDLYEILPQLIHLLGDEKNV